jgi:hypothetical protein
MKKVRHHKRNVINLDSLGYKEQRERETFAKWFQPDVNTYMSPRRPAGTGIPRRVMHSSSNKSPQKQIRLLYRAGFKGYQATGAVARDPHKTEIESIGFI